jgi:hypothetical protein
VRVSDEELKSMATFVPPDEWADKRDTKHDLILDLLEARAEIARLRHGRRPRMPSKNELVMENGMLKQQIADARTEIASLRADGERYRAIRTEAMIVQHGRKSAETYKVSWPFIAAPRQYVYPNYRDRFDAAIDAAIAARQKEVRDGK